MGLVDNEFWYGFLGLFKDVPRSGGAKASYDQGARLSGRGRPRRPLTDVEIAEGHAFIRASLFVAAFGAVGGFGYGIWRTVTAAGGDGFGSATMTILKWTGIGAGAGALLPSALIAALGVAVLAAIFYGLGLLLNFLTSL